MTLLAQAAGIGSEVLLHRHEPIAHRIVQRRPHQRPRQRILDPRRRGDRRLRRLRIQSHSRIVQVIEVEQSDHAGTAADQLLDIGRLGRELETERIEGNDRPPRPSECGDLDRVRPKQGRAFGRIGLSDRGTRDLLRTGPSPRRLNTAARSGPGLVSGSGGCVEVVVDRIRAAQPRSRARSHEFPASPALCGDGGSRRSAVGGLSRTIRRGQLQGQLRNS